MNKKLGLLVLLFTIAGNQFAARSDCFRPYRTEIANKSGGLAIIQKTNGLSGVSRKLELENNSTLTVMVKKRGATLNVLAGPEDNKTSRHVEFYSKEPNTFTAQVTLNPKGITTSGFSTQNKIYNVKLVNESGGIVKIIDGCAVTGIGQTLADGKSAMISVKPDGFLVVQSGPENKKVTYRINFADQTGNNPTITFVKRGFMSSGIQHKNIDIQSRRIFMPLGIRKAQSRISQKLSGKKMKHEKREARNNATINSER